MCLSKYKSWGTGEKGVKAAAAAAEVKVAVVVGMAFLYLGYV